MSSTVARWDGTRWKPLAGGNPSGGTVYDLDLDREGRVYAAGRFDSAGTKAGKGVARWDGTDWHCMELYYEFDPGVTALTLVGDQVFAANGLGVFRWNGSGWDSLSPVIRGAITRMGNSGGKLWVAGRFTVDGDSTLRNLVVRDGARWTGFGSGPGPIRDFAVRGEEVFAIESHAQSDRTDSQVVVRWSAGTFAGVGDTRADIDGDWRVFDPLGRVLPVLEGKSGGRAGLDTQGPRILIPLATSPD